MFRIEMLPAAHGDALWIEYGSSTRPNRILIDAGPVNSYDTVFEHLKTATKRRKDIELFVITHIDTDHIDGAVLLLRDPALTLEFRDIWFNAWQQLAAEPGGDVYGPEQGEFVQALINLRNRPWNRAFAGKAAVVPDAGGLPVAVLADNLRITLLSPGDRQLRRLRRNWESVITDAGWNPGDSNAALDRLSQRRVYEPTVRRDVYADTAIFGTDNAVANGSSIAFVLDYPGPTRNLRCLFTGDAFPDVIAAGLDRYAAANSITGRIPFDAVKVSHHGSMKNWSSDLQRRLTSSNYLVSTSGARFRHPNTETINLIIGGEPNKSALWFNYRSEFTKAWETLGSAGTTGFTSHYPPVGAPEASVTVEL